MVQPEERRYPYTVLRHDDFDALLEDRDGTVISDGDLLPFAFRRGRVLLLGHAGSGKSTLLAGLAEHARGRGIAATVTRTPQPGDAPGRPWDEDGVRGWLQDAAHAGSGAALLVVDGLDETEPQIADLVLEAAEWLTAGAPDCAVVLADRLVRRPVKPSRWGLLRLSPNADPTSAAAGWLGLPLYRQLWDRGVRGKSPQDLLDAYARRVLDDDAYRQVGQTLLEWSRAHHTPVLDKPWLEDFLGGRTVATLLRSGLLVPDEESPKRLRLYHALAHLAFIAPGLASDPTTWSRVNFEALTFRGANFEGLGLLLSRVQDEEVDALVRAVDNWNYYAAGYLLGEDQRSGHRVSGELRSALLLMLALRQFDTVQSTKQQVRDLLTLHDGDLARSLLVPTDPVELVEVAKAVPAVARWWPEWLKLFAGLMETHAPAEHVARITDGDGLLGWTAANVVRRLELAPEQLHTVKEIATAHPDDTARWRAVHVLGGRHDLATAEFCLGVFDGDSSRWVCYGALRSFLAISSQLAHVKEREYAFELLAKRAERIHKSERWKREVERSMQLSSPPADWANSASVLIEHLWAVAETVEEQDRWRSVGAALRHAVPKATALP